MASGLRNASGEGLCVGCVGVCGARAGVGHARGGHEVAAQRLRGAAVAFLCTQFHGKLTIAEIAAAAARRARTRRQRGPGAARRPRRADSARARRPPAAKGHQCAAVQNACSAAARAAKARRARLALANNLYER